MNQRSTQRAPLRKAMMNARGVVFDTGMVCPVCSSKALVKEEGCVKCMACGYSKCG